MLIPSDLKPFIEIFLFLISLHPLIYICFNKIYQSSNTRNSYYIDSDWISRFGTNSFTIIFSIILSCFVFFVHSWLLLVPLLLTTWICFIRDRFKALSRGLGAPGYFTFLFTLTLTSHYLLNTKYILLNQSHLLLLNWIIGFIYSVIYVEFGFIFISAGLFKILDTNKVPLSFALGLLNPMWSKVYLYIKFIEFNRLILNWLGPLLQLIAGLLIVSANTKFAFVGFLLIALMFLSITPFTRLSWLCPSIASLSIYHLLILNDINSININLIFLAVFIRALVYIFIIKQYFGILPITYKRLMEKIVYIYRKLMGVIVWKVFTFDIVRNVALTKGMSEIVESSESTIGLKEKESFIKLSSYTNVYDSITVSALLSSEDYLEPDLFQDRINHFCMVMGIERLISLRVSPKVASEKYENKGPFMRGEMRIFPITEKPATNRKLNYNFDNYNSREKFDD